MLAAAQREWQAGRKVLVGLVETHGRAETEQQLHDLELLAAAHAGLPGAGSWTSSTSMQPDTPPGGAAARRAGTQQCEGLTPSQALAGCAGAAGGWVSRWTTLNVQHLESLNDVVGGIVGIQVHGDRARPYL